MALKLSKAQRDELMETLSMAEPYPPDAPELSTLDCEMDFKRWNATMAKKFLEQGDLEKAQAESTA